MVAGLRNVGDDLAGPVAEGLGLPGLPDPLPAAREPVRDLPSSPPLSILANGPDSFAGRKIGILVTDGVDAAKLDEVKSAAEQAQVNVELIAPAVGGVDDSDGTHAPADQKIDGGPSVLYDAVILLASKHAAPALAAQPAVRDFVADAYAHCKFIGYTGDASPLFEAAGLGGLTDDGFVSLDEHSAADFISRCAKLRFWPRQAAIAQRAGPANGIRRPRLTGGIMAKADTARDSGQSEVSMLGIYLNDHLAGATAGTELAHRTARSHGDGQDSGTLRRLAAEIAQDRAALLDIMAALGIKVRRYKVGAAWVGEKAGRKFNGRLFARSPLSDLEELEMLRLGVEGKAAGWRTLRTLADTDTRLDPARLDELISRARRQADLLEDLRVGAASQVVRACSS